jgi:uncharacterized SAM-binding protein YcdF (DUF218 family)
LLLALLSLLLWRFRRVSALLLITGIAWLYIASTAIFADLLMAPLENHHRPKAMSVIPKADAIVVLGGATRGDTHFSSMGDLNQRADRLTNALALYRAGKAPRILLSGGAGPGHRAEAELMREHLELMGVPRRALMMERESRDTNDNALYSAILLKGKGIKRVLLVTSGFHMRRSVALFERQGLEVIAAPTDFQRLVGEPSVPPWLPTADDLVRTTTALREYVGYIVYRYRGWI